MWRAIGWRAWFGSVRFLLGSAAVQVAVIATSLVGCGDGGGTSSASGGDTGGSGGDAGDGGQDESGNAVVQCGDDPDVIEPASRDEQANAAPATPGCGGAAIGPAPTQSEVGSLEGIIPGHVLETDPALVGAWSEVIEPELVSQQHLAIHSIHRPPSGGSATGRYLQFGAHAQGGSAEAHDKVLWYPPEPCSPLEVGGNENCATAFDLDPGTPEFEHHVEVPQAYDLFCSGHANLPPANAAELIEPLVLVAGGSIVSGGNNGINTAVTFSEAMPDIGVGMDFTWDDLTPFNQPRWYPTTTSLADGRTMVIGGLTLTDITCGAGSGTECPCDPQQACDDGQTACTQHPAHGAVDLCNPDCSATDACEEVAFFNDTVEILDRAGGGFTWTVHEGALGSDALTYPQMFVLPDLPHFEDLGWNLGGKLVYAGAESDSPPVRSKLYDPSQPEPLWVEVGGESCARGSSAVMVRPGKLMKFGGGAIPSRVTEVLDFTSEDDPDPQWEAVAATGMRRHYSSGVLLPDGMTLATGGNARAFNGDENDASTPEDERYYAVFTTEMFDADDNSWCRLADLPDAEGMPPGGPTHRGYHSQSFLLRDGRVLLGASGRRSGQIDHYNYRCSHRPICSVARDPRSRFHRRLATPPGRLRSPPPVTV